jgi:hypothetical protein
VGDERDRWGMREIGRRQGDTESIKKILVKIDYTVFTKIIAEHNIIGLSSYQ